MGESNVIIPLGGGLVPLENQALGGSGSAIGLGHAGSTLLSQPTD